MRTNRKRQHMTSAVLCFDGALASPSARPLRGSHTDADAVTLCAQCGRGRGHRARRGGGAPEVLHLRWHQHLGHQRGGDAVAVGVPGARAPLHLPTSQPRRQAVVTAVGARLCADSTEMVGTCSLSVTWKRTSRHLDTCRRLGHLSSSAQPPTRPADCYVCDDIRGATNLHAVHAIC